MKRLFVLFFIWQCSPLGAFAQQYSTFTNYVINGYGFNPAVIGLTENFEARTTNRTQWVGFDGLPQTNIFAINGHVKRTPLGLGAYVYNDGSGRLNKTGFNGMLSFTQTLSPKAQLHFGVAGGFSKLGLDDAAFVNNPNDPIVLNAQSKGLWIPDLSVGVFFQQKEGFFAGFSVPQLYKKRIVFDPTVQRMNTSEIVRQYYGIVGHLFKVSPLLSFEPSALIKISPNVTPQYDVSLRAIFNKMFWIGGSFRSEDAVTAMLGAHYKKWTLAYSYDITTSSIRTQSAGSHEVTLGIKFGKGENKCPDNDGDGICDKEDQCPTEPGPKERKGCPDLKEVDRDKDGTPDISDECPDLPGPKSNKGCPTNDRDNDGIRDDIDECPDIPGTLKNRGCPLNDRDRDGIVDDIDPCPDQYGSLENRGCPDANDRDRDGVPDKDDLCPDTPGDKDFKGCPKGGDRDKDGITDELDGCPNTAGTQENNGCPTVSDEEKEQLELAIKDLYFDTDKWSIRPASYRNLNNIVTILKRHKDWKLQIIGHADIRGNQAYNLILSKNRANAVKNYLVSKGISPSRFMTDYQGASQPVGGDKNPATLQMSRRVEMSFFFD